LNAPSGKPPFTHFSLMNDPGVNVMQRVLAGAADREIVACEAALRAAQLAADVDALDRLIADDLLFTGPDGQLATRAQDLDAHRSGAVRFVAHDPEELRIRRVGTDVAVAALRARLTVSVAGTLVSGAYRYTRVWAREGGGPWRVAGGHVSAVPDAGPAAGPRVDG
jgi:ketosteroid isomerase-like protein